MKIEQILKTSKKLSSHKKIVVSILYTSGQLSNILNGILKPFDISLQQFNVLRILRGQQNEAVSLAVVQERMINKMSNTTRLIDKLVNKGLVYKEINSSNRRKIDINITNEGLEILDYVDTLIEEAEKHIVNKLSEKEKDQLIRLLAKIR
ncbi:MarR family transcriptional regulator [Yeosuana sp. MJ-SS3]|uniref:MarR family transcriptional regulator n=1 Tax=Gilvirhabdus luticola TaxID=3079858 RepID=A0ABU3U4L1_9FLAO|nr:MarR family transcriptional regulator [Yeosuana sp. MJ-SS3]MDU8885349.1 MarR family transcriptional regulator [Yeosuana sp. MJ-SS3]